MARAISVSASGDISTGVSAATSGQNCACPSVTSPGLILSFKLLSEHASADVTVSQAFDSVDSAGSPVSLPVPAGMRGFVFYLRILDDGPLDVSLTHATQGATTYPVNGMMLMEFADDEYVTAATVQGVAEFEWLMSGERP